MPAVILDLARFSFERNDETWSGPINANLGAQRKCVVLAGINAGGKTLILNSLENFGCLLCEPNRLNLSRFEYLFRAADVKSISVTYSGRWWTSEYDHPLPVDWYDVEVDLNKFCEAADMSEAESHAPPYEFHRDSADQLDSLILSQHYQTRCSMDESGDLTYQRRVGMEVNAEAGIVPSKSSADLPELDVYLTDVIWGEWKDIFTQSHRIEEDKMFSFFSSEHFKQLYSRTGIQLEDEFAAEQYGWWDAKKAFHIIPRPPMMIGIEEAYQISESRKVSLRKATEDMRTPESANMRFARVYERALTSRLQDSGYPIDDLEGIGARPHEDLGLVKEEYDHLDIRRGGWVKREMEVDPRIRIVQSLNFLVHGTRTSRGRELHKLYEEYGGEQSEFLDPLPPAPYFEPPSVFHPDVIPAEEPLGNPDMEKIDYLRTMEKFGSFLRRHDPDLAFWLGMWGFLGDSIFDAFRKEESSYFSSGQSRILSMLSSIVDAPHGTTFLIDEPELSLHIDWQRNLIDVVAHSDRRLIVATHSPDIIYKHPEKVVEVPPSTEV